MKKFKGLHAKVHFMDLPIILLNDRSLTEKIDSEISSIKETNWKILIIWESSNQIITTYL